MNVPGRSRGTRVAILLIVGLTFLWCLQRASTFAWLSISTSYAPYDDEGYVLVSVREFLSGGSLYDDVFTNYGPAFYAYKHLLSIFQGTPTHDLTRLTTLYTWMSAAIFLALRSIAEHIGHSLAFPRAGRQQFARKGSGLC